MPSGWGVSKAKSRASTRYLRETIGPGYILAFKAIISSKIWS
jgi:hypothetical protein